MKELAVKEKFIQLRAQGLSFDKIAKELKTSKQTLIDWSKEFRTTIGNLRAIELEVLQEQYFLTKTKRIEMFGEAQKRIKEELSSRNLSEVPSEKLFDLLIKFGTLLKQEEIPVVFTGAEDQNEALFKSLLTKEVRWDG